MKIDLWINNGWEEGKTGLVGTYPYTPDAAVFFYRLDLPHRLLIEEGIARLRVTAGELEDTDADIIITRGLWSDDHLTFIRQMQAEGRQVVIDVDDHVMGRVPVHVRAWYNQEHQQQIATCLREADALTTTNERLAEHLSKYNENIGIFPNYIDLNTFVLSRHNHSKVRVGWSGGASHREDLLSIAQTLKQVFSKHEVDFVVFGLGSFPIEKIIPCHRVQGVNFHQYFNTLAELEFDIIVAPLADTEFNWCKSDLRLREAAAQGIPVVCSDIGPYKNLQYGIEGFRCSRPKEWIQTLSLLIKDSRLRQRMGDASRERAEAEYNVYRPGLIEERLSFYENILMRKAA